MSLRVKCPSCNTSLTFVDDALGTRITCPSCRAVFELVVPGDPQQPKAEAQEEEAQEEESQDTTPSANKSWLRIAIFVAVMLTVTLLSIVIIILIINANNAPPEPTERIQITKSKPPVTEGKLNRPDPGDEAAKAVRDRLESFGFLGGMMVLAVLLFLLAIAYLALIIGVGVWIARDASCRNQSGVGWMTFYFACHIALASVGTPLLFVFLFGIAVIPFGWVGLVIYFLARRTGSLVQCGHCRNKLLSYALVCPHCSVKRKADNP